MIDIHSHVIYGVDDGPQTLEESLKLIQEAYNQGVRTIVATSHRRKGMFETPEETILKHFTEVKDAASVIADDLTLLYGGELFFTPDILDKLESGKVPTMNGTRFALIEFSSVTPWKDIQQALNKVLMLGITPVVAHIERYNALEFNKERVQEIIAMGCYTQVNASHLTKPKLFGDKLKIYKKRARYFMEEDLIHVVSSDMHNLTNRRPYMKEAYGHIAKEYGTEKADELFETNAQYLLNNEFI